MTHDHDHPAPGHRRGLIGWLQHNLVPHSHAGSDRVDDALESSREGLRAVKISLLVLGLTAVAQLGIYAATGSVALLADTVHNFSDALTAVPLWVAFVLVRRPASRAFTYGLGRVEDLAGLFVVLMIAASASVVLWESIRRVGSPPEITHVWWVFAAGLAGFLGNEAVAVYRIRVGQRIGSAALVADGLHARTDGLASLAVAAGAVAVWAGYPIADPIIGIGVGLVIVWLLVGAARDVGRRLLDGVEPGVEHAIRAALAAPGVEVADLKVRWLGHRLEVVAAIAAPGARTIAKLDVDATAAAARVRAAVPHVGTVTVVPVLVASAAGRR